MKVGDIVVLIEDHNFLGTDYKMGQKFRIISDSGFRGWDLESLDTGQKIYETAFSSHAYVSSISDIRAEKLKQLGI
jgi:hypothetical protein